GSEIEASSIPTDILEHPLLPPKQRPNYSTNLTKCKMLLEMAAENVDAHKFLDGLIEEMSSKMLKYLTHNSMCHTSNQIVRDPVVARVTTRRPSNKRHKNFWEKRERKTFRKKQDDEKDEILFSVSQDSAVNI